MEILLWNNILDFMEKNTPTKFSSDYLNLKSSEIIKIRKTLAPIILIIYNIIIYIKFDHRPIWVLEIEIYESFISAF